jgi:hypothetical protein
MALDDNSRTIAWTTADQADFDAELADARRRTGRRVVISVVAGLLGLGVVTAVIVLLSSRWSDRRSSPPAPAALAATAETVRRTLPSVQEPPTSLAPPPAPPIEDWWVPPSPASPRQKFEVLAYAFSGIDEHDLGAAFTEDLEPIAGAPHVFEERPPRPRSHRLPFAPGRRNHSARRVCSDAETAALGDVLPVGRSPRQLRRLRH